jgi:hypothetical protein
MNGQRYAALGAGGSVPPPPSGFSYPTEETFVAGLTGALDGIDNDFARDNLSIPVAATVPLIKSAVSAAGGLGFSALTQAAAAGNIPPAGAQAISGAMSLLSEGALQIAQQISAGTQQVESVSSAAAAIPMIGAIITWVVDLASGIAGADALVAGVENAAERQLHEQLQTDCAAWARGHQAYSAGTMMEPTDFFRKTGFVYQVWRKSGGPPPRLPLNAASMYVMLCGGETQGFGIDRTRYRQLVAKAKARSPKVGNGIPVQVQRKMWGIIKGILSNVEDPIAEFPIGDRGKSLMAILQDIVREYYLRATHANRNGPGWDRYLADLLSDEVTKRYTKSVALPIPDGAGVVQRSSSCAGQQHGYGRHLNLAPMLVDSVANYGELLLQNFYNKSTGKWTIRPTVTMTAVEPRGSLVLSGQETDDIAGAIDRSTGTLPPRVFTAITALASAGGGYWLARGGYQAIMKLIARAR